MNQTNCGVLVRDRLLSYLSATGVDAVPSLELAAECLRRAEANCDCAAAMDILESVMTEAGHALPGRKQAVGNSLPSRCTPPMTRSSMLACDLSPGIAFAPALSAVKRCVRMVIPGSRPWRRT